MHGGACRGVLWVLTDAGDGDGFGVSYLLSGRKRRMPDENGMKKAAGEISADCLLISYHVQLKSEVNLAYLCRCDGCQGAGVDIDCYGECCEFHYFPYLDRVRCCRADECRVHHVIVDGHSEG